MYCPPPSFFSILPGEMKERRGNFQVKFLIKFRHFGTFFCGVIDPVGGKKSGEVDGLKILMEEIRKWIRVRLVS
jgi:hypothetical protein